MASSRYWRASRAPVQSLGCCCGALRASRALGASCYLWARARVLICGQRPASAGSKSMIVFCRTWPGLPRHGATQVGSVAVFFLDNESLWLAAQRFFFCKNGEGDGAEACTGLDSVYRPRQASTALYTLYRYRQVCIDLYSVVQTCSGLVQTCTDLYRPVQPCTGL